MMTFEGMILVEMISKQKKLKKDIRSIFIKEGCYVIKASRLFECLEDLGYDLKSIALFEYVEFDFIVDTICCRLKLW